MLYYARQERLATDKHSSFLGPFVSYEENKLLWINSLRSYSQQFIFFVTYKWAQKVSMLYYARLEKLARDKHSSFLGSLVSYEENELLWIGSQIFFFEIIFVETKWGHIN